MPMEAFVLATTGAELRPLPQSLVRHPGGITAWRGGEELHFDSLESFQDGLGLTDAEFGELYTESPELAERFAAGMELTREVTDDANRVSRLNTLQDRLEDELELVTDAAVTAGSPTEAIGWNEIAAELRSVREKVALRRLAQQTLLAQLDAQLERAIDRGPPEVGEEATGRVLEFCRLANAYRTQIWRDDLQPIAHERAAEALSLTEPLAALLLPVAT